MKKNLILITMFTLLTTMFVSESYAVSSDIQEMNIQELNLQFLRSIPKGAVQFKSEQSLLAGNGMEVYIWWKLDGRAYMTHRVVIVNIKTLDVQYIESITSL